MARFQPGHPKLGGKRKGSKNKKTIELNLLTRMQPFIDGKPYNDELQRRILRGKAPHMETYLAQRLHGRPADQVELTGADRKPLKITVEVVQK